MNGPLGSIQLCMSSHVGDLIQCRVKYVIPLLWEIGQYELLVVGKVLFGSLYIFTKFSMCSGEHGPHLVINVHKIISTTLHSTLGIPFPLIAKGESSLVFGESLLGEKLGISMGV